MQSLVVENLTKMYGNFKAVDSISFDLEEGEILGFLGPNGAGKTTTLQMLIGSLKPTDGNIKYFNKSLFTHREEILSKINYSTAYTSLPWNLSVEENLTFLSYLYSVNNRKKQLEKIVETFKLSTLMKRRVEGLSAGQKTRVNLAKSFLNSPKVLLLDEPTASLDPDIAKYIRDFILEQRKEEKISVIFTSHNMKEVEQICDRVIFINGGKIIANDTPIQLARKIDAVEIELLPLSLSAISEFCKKNNITFTNEKRYIKISTIEKEVVRILRKLSEDNIEYNEISINKPTLEDYFLKVSLNK